MDRRHFIGSMAALGVQGTMLRNDARAASPAPTPRVKRRRPSFDGFDDNLVAFISDMHISPDEYEPERLQHVVADILALRPLPRHVLGLGDVANLYGEVRDYECARRILQPLWEAGIDVTLGLGNHDRRENFARVFPEQMARSVVDGRMTCVVETPKADFVLLDSLQQADDPKDVNRPGVVDDAQREWLRQTLARATKPTFVCAHHSVQELRLMPVLREAKTCCGYIHGHDHRWRDGWANFDWRSHDVLRTLCLPSTGFWGDIGYALFWLNETRADMELRLFDFFFRFPLSEGEKKPLQWQAIEEDLRGSHCSFAYSRL